MAAYSHLDDVFKALGDPSRRVLLDSLNERNGQTLRELCSRLDMARQSVSKHLAVLEAANLVTTVRRGREKLHYLNAARINEIAERWITRYERDRVHALADLKRALEDTAVDRPSFVYTTYIKTTPERLWQALTEPAFTEAYWGITFDTDWTTVEAWEKLAEQCGRFLHKGSRVRVIGSLHTQSWEDRESGQRRFKTSMRADEVLLLDARECEQDEAEAVKEIVEDLLV